MVQVFFLAGRGEWGNRDEAGRLAEGAGERQVAQVRVGDGGDGHVGLDGLGKGDL